MSFEIIPAIDIRDEEVVQLVGGELNKKESYGDPVSIAIIEKIDAFFQVGGGIRSKEIAIELNNFGADRIILGTAVYQNPDLIKLIKKETKLEVFISLDQKNGVIMSEGWKKESGIRLEEGIKKFSEHDIDGFLLTDIKKEGRMKGIDQEIFSLAREKTDLPVIASGGISSIKDLKKLKKVGVEGAVVGSALYKKSFKFKDAIKLLEQ